MQRAWIFLTLTSLSLAAFTAACSGDDNTPPAPPPSDAGKDTSVPDDASHADSSSDAANDTSAADTSTPDGNLPDGEGPDTNVPDTSPPVDSGPPCAPDAGALVKADWSFAVSAPALNGGKGQVLTVNRCDSVQWTNTETVSHSVVNQPSSAFTWNTGTNSGGAYPPVVFDRAGTFAYECGVHGTLMIGEITVNP